MRFFYTIVFLLLHLTVTTAQTSFSSFNTFYDDSFAEWEIYTDEDKVGSVEMKWKLRNDWSEWNVTVGDSYGTIKIKWDNNPSQWELRINNEIIQIKTVFPRDYSEWRISDGSNEFRLRSKYKNTYDDWSVDHKKLGYLDIYTEWEGDPRDWNIDDGLSEKVGEEVKIAMIFIAIFHSSPKI